MKIKSVLFLALLSFVAAGCLKDSCERTVSYIRVDPVFKTLDEIKNSTAVVEAPRPLLNPGQIYYYDDKIFINERREGIHVIDNSDPAHPQKMAFIAIPGNEDLAIRNGILYANAYIDLLAIDLSSYQVMGRAEAVIPPLWEDPENNRVAVYYKQTPVTEVMDCETSGRLYRKNGVLWDAGPEVFDDFSNVLDEFSFGNSATGAGLGGSMARFTLVDAYLYIVDDQRLHVFGLANPYVPEELNQISLGWGIETILPYQDKLFIGSNSGMFIFDNSNPAAPALLSTFAHARACDPVYVQGNLAYVTLRSGTPCEGFSNQLDVVDISNLTLPALLVSHPMLNPHGLSVQGSDLLLCEGEYGFKRFDATDPMKIGQRLLDHASGLHAFDVIALPGAAKVALVIGEDGFYQYSYGDPEKLTLLSSIPIGQ